MEKLPVIVVVGPTASGKTALAVDLAKRVGGEVVSFDSMQIYRGMHIASAAPSAEEMQGIKHHLLEFLNPEESFSVADFVKKAKEVCTDIASRGKKVIIAGGTGLYINSFIDNVTFSESEQNPLLRSRLNDEYDRIGGEEMLKRLAEFDPESALRLHPNNKKRVIRAFEIYLTSGITITKQLEESKNEESPYIPFMIGLTYDHRELLYNRIDLRVDKMLEAGLLDEAKEMYKNGRGGTGMQAIGHKEFFPYFGGEISLEQAIEELKRQTRRYAKRQLTWFRRDERISWIYRDKTDDTLSCALKILERNGYFGKTTQTD